MDASGNGSFFAGLHGYEIALIGLGLLLFLVGLWAVAQGGRSTAVNAMQPTRDHNRSLSQPMVSGCARLSETVRATRANARFTAIAVGALP